VVERIVVSHKPDHGSLPRPGSAGQTAGRLHNDTAYGFTGEERNGVPVVVHRVPFLSLTEKDLPGVRDARLARALQAAMSGLSGKALIAALERFQAEGPYKGIRHVRIAEVVGVIAIRDREGRAYKGYASGGNYRFDVWELPDGRWDAEVVSMFDAHNPAYRSRMRDSHHNPRKIMSLMIGDAVAYESPDTGRRVIARVRKFDQRNKQLYLDAHNETGKLDERHADPDDHFRNFSKTPNALRAIKVRQVRVDETGRVFDPGPQDRESRSARKQAAAG
jgi:CRISPR-associated endonuclease Csn1